MGELTSSSAAEPAINAPAPAVSVLVCTRNRPKDLMRVIHSLLESQDVELELIIVDQSDSAERADVLARMPHDPRLRYVCSQTAGKSAAMNEGVRLARAAYVVCTDDDCEALPEWVAGMFDVLRRCPSVGLVFCNVIAAPHDPDDGYVPSYEREKSRLITSVFSTLVGRGLGAGMACRRDALLEVGGMDEDLGPGGRFPSSEDWDVQLR